MTTKKNYIEIIKRSPYYYQIDNRITEDYFPTTTSTFTWEKWKKNLPVYCNKERVFLEMVECGMGDGGLETVPPVWLWDKEMEYHQIAPGAMIVKKKQQYGSTACFVGDTPIWTIEGIKPIQDLRVGDCVATHKGRFSRVAILFRNTCHGRRLYVVHSVHGKVATATEDHPFLVYNELLDLIVWKRVDQLTPHDFLMRSFLSPSMHLPRPDYSVFRDYPQLNNFINMYPETAGLVVSRVNENHGVLHKQSHEHIDRQIFPTDGDGNMTIYEDIIFLLTDVSMRIRLWKWALSSGQRKFVEGWMSVFQDKTLFTCKEEVDLVSMVLNLYQYNMEVSMDYYHFFCCRFQQCKWKLTERSSDQSIKKKDDILFVKYSHKKLIAPYNVNKNTIVHSMNVDGDHSYSVNGHVVENCGTDNDKVYAVRVAGHTRVLTRHGIITISSKKDEIVSVWNGEVFVDTMIKEVGSVSMSYRIHFSNGVCIVCAPSHLFLLENGQTVSASDAQNGDTLAPFGLPIMTPNVVLPSSISMTLEWVANRCVYMEDWVVVYDKDPESLRDILLDLQYCGVPSWIVHNPHRNEHELRMDKIQWRLLNNHQFNDRTIGMLDVDGDDTRVCIKIVRIEECGFLPTTFSLSGGILEGVVAVEEMYAYLDLAQFLKPNPMRVHLQKHEIVVFTTADNPFTKLLAMEYNKDGLIMKDITTCEEEWERKRHAHALSNVPAIFLDNGIYVGDFIDFWDKHLCPVIDTDRLYASICELLRYENTGMRIGVYGFERLWVEMRLSSDDPRIQHMKLYDVLQPPHYFKFIKEDLWDACRDKLVRDMNALGVSIEEQHQILSQRSIQNAENIPNYLKKIYK